MLLGREDDFFIVQKLSCLLTAQARNSGLFMQQLTQNPKIRSLDHQLSTWANIEMRKRLAFAIFRTEAYLSNIFHTRPMVSAEEMHIELPCPHSIWTATGYEATRRVFQFMENSAGNICYTFAELLHVAMNRGEVLPPLSAQDHEFLLLALQEKSLRFSEDPKKMRMARQISGPKLDEVSSYPSRPASTSCWIPSDGIMLQSPLSQRYMGDTHVDLD
jgi:hypothetical protein